MKTGTIGERVSEDAIFRIGTVTSVDGRVVHVKVDKTKNTSHLVYRGRLLKNVSVGSYVKIAKGFTSIIGKVDGESISEDAEYGGTLYGSDRQKIDRTLNVKLLGFFDGPVFKRGIKELPLLDNECFILQEAEFDQVHNFLKPDDVPITIGALALEKGQKIQVGIDGLFASHIGIFGNTGSGKSYTLASLYRNLFEKYKQSKAFIANAQFFLIDFNGEYVDQQDENIIIEKQFKNIYALSTRNDFGDKFPLTAEAISSEEFWYVFLDATEKIQRPFIARALANNYFASHFESENELKTLICNALLIALTSGDKTVEKGAVTNFLEELSICLNSNGGLHSLSEDYRDHLHFHSLNAKYYYESDAGKIFSDAAIFGPDVVKQKVSQLVIPLDWMGPIDLIRLKIVFQYFNDTFRGYANREFLAPLIKRMDSRIGDLKKVLVIGELPKNKNFTIVSLKDVNIRVRKILPLLLCKKLYDDKKASDDGTAYLNIIIDEAHNILSEESSRESEQWRDYRLETFEEIIKEGRKFGVFLTLASQRPSDISDTIISQLHNYFLHRLVNDQDIKAVERTISYLDKLSFEYLPILPTGSCIFAGLLASVPVVIDILQIDRAYEPRNKTRPLTSTWE